MTTLLRPAPSPVPAFAQFAAIGAFGFVIDASVLQTLISLVGISAYSARGVSYILAATATWWLNRNITFRGTASEKPMREWAKFLLANAFGGLLNYAVFAVLVSAWGSTSVKPVLAAATGSAVGLIVNFLLSRQLVFTSSQAFRPSPPQGKQKQV